MSELWDRRKGESSKAYAALSQYLALGPQRSLVKTCQVLGRPAGYRTTLEDWSVKYEWVHRAQCYDDEQFRQQRLAQEEEIRKAKKRHAKQAQLLQSKAREKLLKVDPEDLTPNQIAIFLELGMKEERTSFDLPATTFGLLHGGEVKRDDSTIRDRILDDPEFRAAALDLFGRLRASQGVSGRVAGSSMSAPGAHVGRTARSRIASRTRQEG